jgi:predicted amidohydrolase YtcJ
VNSADLVVRGGAIYAMDPPRNVYRAVAIAGGRIVAVSSDANGLNRELIGPTTQVVDDPTLTVLPAFFDNHNHLGEASRNSLFVEVGDARSIDDFVDRIRQWAARTPAGQWIQTSNNWSQEQLLERRLPLAADLDQATRDHPVIARRGGHLAILNSAGLRLAAIDRTTPDPPGGRLGHTPEGEPDGTLEGGAQYALVQIPPPSVDDQVASLKTWCDRFAGVGLGGVRDPLVTVEQLHVYRTALERGDLSLRVRLMPRIGPEGSVAERIDALDALNEWRALAHDNLRIWGLKFVFDGGPESGALTTPYASDPHYSGQLNWNPDELEQVVSAAAERGWRVGTHAIGDLTVRTLLDVYERVLTRHPAIPAGTLVIEHAFLADAEQRARAIRLGVWITVQHPLLYALGGSLLKLWGAERTRHIMPVRAWLDEGAQLSAGTDYPIGSYSPLETVWGMTTRQTDRLGVQGPEYAVDRSTAVWLAGAATANLLGESDSLGSIQPGHFADLVAYPADPLTCPVDELRTLHPAWTLVGGRAIYGSIADHSATPMQLQIAS